MNIHIETLILYPGVVNINHSSSSANPTDRQETNFSSVSSESDSDTSSPSSIPPDFFRISERFSEENIRERLDAELAQATSKIDYCRGLYRLEHIGCINIRQYASDAKRAIVFNQYQSRFVLASNDFCRARMNNQA